MMAPLQRLTTTYVEDEDRMRLSGEAADGSVQALWLTQRMLARLVPHLCAWLERQTPWQSGQAPAVADHGGLAQQAAHGFAQQAAQDQLHAHAPEPVVVQQPAWLVVTVNVQSSEEGVQLLWQGALPEQQAGVVLSAQALRQWLGIVYRQYQRAQWPLAQWPLWMDAGASVALASAAGVLH